MERRKRDAGRADDRRSGDRRVIPRFSNSEFRSSLTLVDLFLKIYIPFVLCAGCFELAHGLKSQGQALTRGIFFVVVCFALASMAWKTQKALKSYLDSESITKLVIFQKTLGMKMLGLLATGCIIYIFSVIFRV